MTKTDPIVGKRPTPAQQKALRILRAEATVKVSNRTDDGPIPTIYWKVADWLTNNGFAAKTGIYADYIRLTHKGRALADLQVPDGEPL